MRISTGALHQQGIQNILRNQGKLAHTQNQLALGTRLTSAAEDPAAWARAEAFDQQLSQLARYRANTAVAINRLGLEETALGVASESLNRIRELALQANSPAQSAASRHDLALEMQTRLEELLGAANSDDGNGHYLFAGSTDTAVPFALAASGATYSGDQNVQDLEIATERRVALGDAGDLVFQKITTASGPQDVFAVVQDLIALVDTLPTDDVGRTQQQADFAAGLSALDAGLAHFNDVRATVGNRLSAIDNSLAQIDALEVQVQTSLSDLRDLDYAEATGRLNMQMVALEAAQQSYVRIQGLTLFDFLR